MKHKQYCFWCDLFAAFFIVFGFIGLTFTALCIGHNMFPKVFWPVAALSLTGFVVDLRIVFKNV